MVGRRGVVAILFFFCSYFLILRGEEMSGEDGMGHCITSSYIIIVIRSYFILIHLVSNTRCGEGDEERVVE